MFLFLICKRFFVPFYTGFNKFYGLCVKKIGSFSQVNIWTSIWFFRKCLHVVLMHVGRK
jgi:hypothetical protein